MTSALSNTRQHRASRDRDFARHSDHAAFHNQGAPHVRGEGAAPREVTA